MQLKENLFELNVLNEMKCYILITLMYMPNTCRLVWNKNSAACCSEYPKAKMHLRTIDRDGIKNTLQFFTQSLIVRKT